MQKHCKMNGNKYTMSGNLWDATNAMLGVKFISLNTYIKKEDLS